MPDGVAAAAQQVLASGNLAQGERVRQFESALGDYIGNPNVTAVSDRSGALTLALYLSGVRPGDEIIASPMSCVATTMPIANLFARPVWCDVDVQTGMIDPRQIEPLITERTRAIVAYHWGGDVCALDAVCAIARKHGLKVIDDASAAFGAEHIGRRLGSNGTDFTVYSFYAVSHLTTGEGGALVCRSPEDRTRAMWLKRYGLHQSTFRLPNGDINPDSDVPVSGFNFAMHEPAGAMGSEQLKHAEFVVSRCRGNGRYYDTALRGIAGVELLRRPPDCISGYWVYSLLAERRMDLMRKLREQGIDSRRLHLRNDRYSCFGTLQRALPGVDAFDARTLSIPCGYWVGAEERERIADIICSGW